MRLLPLLLLAACAPPPPLSAPAPLPLPHVVQTSHPGGGASASAVPLFDRRGFAWYLTARHCLPVATVGGQEVLHAYPHPKRDLAVLKVRGTVGAGTALATRLPRLGDRLLAMGYGVGAFLQMTDGRAGPKPGQMTCPIIYGASGGAVLNANGELVGIISQVMRISNGFTSLPITHISIYVPVVGVKTWILSATGV